MPIDYTIKAIPTLYNGRIFRSRLEAKYAAMFTLLRWEFEYESIDLGPWSPDFQLIGDPSSVHVYVEVKPITAFDNDTMAKMVSASDPKAGTHVLLVGVKPLLPPGPTPDGAAVEWRATETEIGWGGRVWGGRWPLDSQPVTPVSIEPRLEEEGYDLFNDAYWIGWLYSGKRPKLTLEEREQHKSTVRKLWDEASNAVQWHGKDAT